MLRDQKLNQTKIYNGTNLNDKLIILEICQKKQLKGGKEERRNLGVKTKSEL